ncbi:MAG: hypothetical protein ABW277_23095 [Longimicrobiaceae bacterium]
MANHSIRGSMMGPEEKDKKVPRGGRLRTIYPAPVGLRFSAYAAALKSLQGELALEFFRILRRVRAWADTSEDNRADLFELDQRQVKEGLGRACGRVPRLVEAFGTFAQLVRAPADVAPATVAEACAEVMDWAAEEGKLELAVLFAEAAATADPLDANRANSAGRACRWAARMERAASWYQRAFGLAVRAKNRQAVIDALLGYGNVLLDQDRHSEAKVYFERAARRAATTGRLRQAGKAHHDLLSIAAEVGTLKEGYRHVVAALGYYPAGDVRLPGLAHDWGFHLVRLQLYSAAVPVLQLASPRAPSADEEAIFLATLAWAFAGSRRREPFETAAARCVELLETCRQYAAGAYLHLAAGAMAFGLWKRAEEYLKEAKKAARRRKQEALASEADELLKLARKRELAPPEAATIPLEGGLEALARVFRRLRTRIGTADAPARARAGADASSEIARRVRGGV